MNPWQAVSVDLRRAKYRQRTPDNTVSGTKPGCAEFKLLRSCYGLFPGSSTMVPTPRPEDKSRRTEITSTIVTEALTRASLPKDPKNLYHYSHTKHHYLL